MLTLFFGTCQFCGQAADKEQANAGVKEGEKAYWAFGPEQASQPMELRKELTELR